MNHPSDIPNTFLAFGFLVTCVCLFMSLAGCAVPLEVDVEVGVDLDDRCLLLFPECNTDSPIPYRCVDAAGTVDLGCEVACVAGRVLTCDPDGPTCTQRVGDEEHWVPVVCVDRTPED